MRRLPFEGVKGEKEKAPLVELEEHNPNVQKVSSGQGSNLKVDEDWWKPANSQLAHFSMWKESS